jgi:AcrR family transcriptional regulator
VPDDGLRARKKEQTRQRLIDSAIRLLKERGYEGATVELIAEGAEVSVTTLFRYFESKEDVFLASLRSLYDRFERAIRERPPGIPVLQALREIVLELVGEFSPRGADEFSSLDRVPELHDRLREYEDHRPRRAVLEAFAEELGVVPTDMRPQLLTGAVMAAFAAVRTAWTEGRRDTPLVDEMNRAFDLVEEMAEPILRGTAS